MKKFIYNRFLNESMNISLLISCLTIIVVQTYFIINDWMMEIMGKFFDYMGGNQLLIVFISAIFPLMPGIVGFSLKKLEVKKQDNIKKELEEHKTEVFPGAITKDMIKAGEVICVSERTWKNLKKKKPMMLDRKSQCDTLCRKLEDFDVKDKELNCLYLTGTSGAGKSIFLGKFVKEQLKKEGILYFNEYDIACDLIFQKIEEKKPKYVIMDQFEKSLENKDIYVYIRKIVEEHTPGIVFIFGFPQEFFEQICKNIDTHILNPKGEKEKIQDNTCTYFLGCDEDDIEQLKILVNTFLKTGMEMVNECLAFCEENFSHSGVFLPVLSTGRYPESLVFLCSILTKIKIGISPLVEFSTVSYIYELYRDDIDYNIDIYIDNIDKIFELYLDNWINCFRNRETGKIILQILCDGKRYNMDDIKCVTFEKKENLVEYDYSEEKNKEERTRYNITHLLKKNTFISLVPGFSGFKTGVWIVHDYIALKINEYCFKNLDNKIRQNIEHYRKEMVNKNLSYSTKSESKTKVTILKRYESYYKRRNVYFVNIFLIILMMGSIGVSCINGANYNNKLNNVYYIFIALGCFFSTYYMYNIVMRFLKMMERKYYYPVTICGTILVVLCYVFPDYWGVFLGFEIVILGYSLYQLRKITVNMAVGYFREKGLFYIGLGVVVIAFGGIYVFYKSNLELRLTLDFFFLVYVVASNISHINYTYVMSKIGMGNTI